MTAKPSQPKPAVSANPTGPNALLSPGAATQKAPEEYKVLFQTTKGDFVVSVHRAWAPKGADRFFNLVTMGYFDNAPFFRVVSGFMVQFGINADGAVNAKWRTAVIADDGPGGHSNSRGMITFATAGPNTRTTQFFINYGDNGRLDGMGFTPFAVVAQGMDVIDNLFKGYGEGAPMGAGPDQNRIQMEGNAYLRQGFPKLDYVKSAKLL